MALTHRLWTNQLRPWTMSQVHRQLVKYCQTRKHHVQPLQKEKNRSQTRNPQHPIQRHAPHATRNKPSCSVLIGHSMDLGHLSLGIYQALPIRVNPRPSAADLKFENRNSPFAILLTPSPTAPAKTRYSLGPVHVVARVEPVEPGPIATAH
ncbi:hypothetical protein Cflav_PD1246 [Pedosphaera parvula Ellin514]|uniref:Uncharacterized protein n=1 Tax=Pedosphaera parvula (strain Ellin514) TaxID=320771 RepID=B9XNU6_PEDPL|nr:hypothetical protein Cflav_PD1246 [Pedosphaera parvula Ellin514]